MSDNPKSVTTNWRDEGGKRIALITVDNPPVNALSHHVRDGISREVKAAQAEADAIVLAGANGTFIAGADIREFGKPLREPILFQLCDEIEASGVPITVAIEGNTLGGGLETALACHYRVANPKAKLGLPEVNLGLLPGAGGTQRLPRLLNDIARSVEFVTSGRPVSGKAAGELGLVDFVADNTVDAAVAHAAQTADVPFDGRRLSQRQLAITEAENGAFDEAMTHVRKRARGANAPVIAAQSVRKAYDVAFADGIAHERAMFKELVTSDQSKALRHIFFAERQAAKLPEGAKNEPCQVTSVGVLGAGTMGGGIAMTFAEAGLPVVLLEQSDEALDRGFSTIEKNWARGIKSGRISQAGVDERMARLSRTTNYAELSDCDLIIEAVFETMDVKREVFSKLNEVAKPTAILATNTSYLDIDEISKVLDRPENLVGMHYFSPANIMRLLEIVRAGKTSDVALATAMSMAKCTRKQAVVAGVGHGFIGNRLLTPYQRQAHLLVLEGASPQQVDDALTDFGWAMGPFAVSDLAGIDIGYKSRKDQDLQEFERALYTVPDALAEAGQLGQKSGSGFYVYNPETRAPSESQQASDIIEKARRKLGYEPRTISDSEIVERCMYALANEGAHVLAEGVAQRASDIDVVYVHGYGYPRWRGGPMCYADTIGLSKIADRLDEWSSGAHADHWSPSDLLMELAEEGRSFSDFDKASGEIS